MVWTALGAGTADDGSILNMGRTADASGYLANYYRWYGIPEAPFDWYYSFLAHWTAISPSLLGMHLPPLLAGLASWFVLSRVLLPRLGAAVRRSGWAIWAAALVFLAFWLPFNSGLRSETMIVLGSVLTWWAAEQAIATRRLLPAALAAIAAGFTLALAPHGVIAVAILLVSARPLLHILLDRRRRVAGADRGVPRPDAGHCRGGDEDPLPGGAGDQLASGVPALLLHLRHHRRRHTHPPGAGPAPACCADRDRRRPAAPYPHPRSRPRPGVASRRRRRRHPAVAGVHPDQV